jgi:two-component system, NtrC family, response regulator HydG
MSKLLIVDDDKDVLLASRVVLRSEFEIIRTECDPFKLQQILRAEEFDVILLDMNFSTGTTSGKEGIHWLKEILKINAQANVVLITAYGDLNLAVEAMKIGAIDFVVKPWDNEKLVATVKSALRLSKSKNEIRDLKSKQSILKEELEKSYQEIVGKSKIMKDLLDLVKKVAPTNANVLILGENGTGKELIARAIHRHSDRSNQIFVNLDLGALSPSLFESELFGHTKGAYTDAKQDREGRFESAKGGTLFLDEIGNMKQSQQTKLLSVLEKRVIYRLGSNEAIPIDIRLISATNTPISELNEEYAFRKDLLYRINTVQIDLPPLRERKEDIPLLINFFTKKYLKQYNKTDIKFSKEALKKLSKYHWPGNIRELKHLVARAIIMCNSQIIEEDDIWLNIEQSKLSSDSLNIENLEKNAIIQALSKNQGNLTKAAKALGLGRTTLYRKMDKYDL